MASLTRWTMSLYTHPSAHCSTVHSSQDVQGPRRPPAEECVRTRGGVHACVAIKKNDIALFVAARTPRARAYLGHRRPRVRPALGSGGRQQPRAPGPGAPPEHHPAWRSAPAPVNADTEKAMATHSSTLAWKIPWAEEPGVLQFMGSQRVGHN